MSFFLNTILFLVSFVGVLSFLVFFHELGHYAVGRFFKVSVERFSIGFGKPIWRRTAKSGTEWTISRIPLGGYVKFLGDKGAASNPDADQLEDIKQELTDKGDTRVEDCFHFKPLWQRALIVLAGPLANFLLAAIIYTFLFMGHTENVVQSHVIAVAPNQPAAEAGLRPGDILKTMNGRDVSNSRELISVVAMSSNDTLETVFDRDGTEMTLNIVPIPTERKDAIGGTNVIGGIGVNVGGEGYVTQRTITALEAPAEGVKQVGKSIAMTGTYLKRIFQGKEDGKALGGVVRIGAMTGKMAVDSAAAGQTLGEKIRFVFRNLLSLAAALSIGLGVANLMPIPALDGGHLMFYGYEAIAGRPLSEKKQEVGFALGFALILTAFVYLTWNDIGYVGSLFENAGKT